MADKRTTVDDIVGELRSGMTIGIGGWGSRRKPMAVVRAICRSDLTRPHRRRLRRPRRRAALRHRQGAQGGVRVRHPRLHRPRSALARRAPARPGRGHGGRRGDVLPRPPGRLLARPLPAHPGRAGLRRPHRQPRPATGALALRRGPPVSRRPRRRRRRAGGHAGPPPRCGHRPHQPGRRRRQRPGAEPRPLLRPALPRRRRAPLHDHRVHRGERRAGRRGPPALERAHPPHAGRRRRRGPGGAHFTANPPDYGRDESFQKEYAAAAADPAEWEAFANRYVFVGDDEYRAHVAERTAS